MEISFSAGLQSRGERRQPSRQRWRKRVFQGQSTVIQEI